MGFPFTFRNATGAGVRQAARLAQEARRWAAVYQPVIESQAQPHHLPHNYFALAHRRLGLDTPHTQDGTIRRLQKVLLL